MNIYEKLTEVQNKLKAPKSQYNGFGKYNYRNCEDILEALKPLLLEYKLSLFITDKLIQVGERYYIQAETRLINCEKTEEVIFNIGLSREEEDKKNFDQSQITGSASSYARKYALNGLFAIDDTKDSDATNNGSDEKKGTKKPIETKGNTTTIEDKKQLSEAQIKRLYAIIKSAGKTEEDFKKYIKEKLNIESAYDLTRKQYDEICDGFSKK